MSTFGIHRLGWLIVRTWNSSDTEIEEILNKVFRWHKFPVSLKAEVVILYFKGLSLRTVREFLLHKGYEVSIETIRECYHAVGKALQAIYTIAVWVYVDETKVKVRDRTYYLYVGWEIQESCKSLGKKVLARRGLIIPPNPTKEVLTWKITSIVYTKWS